MNAYTQLRKMKNTVRSLCIASLVLGGASLLRAEDKPAAPAAPAAQEAPKKHTAEALPPEQREAKQKAAKAKFDAKLKDLREQKAAGKISEEDAKKLEAYEKRAKAMEKHADKAEHKAEHKAETK